MKIKENSSALKLKIVVPICGFALLAGLILRCLQIVNLIEVETGFYTQNSFITVLFNAIIIIACAAAVVVSFLSSDSKNIYTNGLKSKVLFASSTFLGIAFLFDAASSIFSKTADVDPVYVESTLFKSLMSSGALPLSLQGLFAFLSAVYFFILAKSFLKGDNGASKRKILALSPVCWVIFRLIFLFVRKISFVKVSDLFYELIMLGFAALFFMAFAQVTSNVYSEGFGWRLVGFGLPAGLIAGVLSISKLIFTFINQSAYINANHKFRITDLALAVFIFTLCSALVKCKKPEPAIEEAAEEASIESEEGNN